MSRTFVLCCVCFYLGIELGTDGLGQKLQTRSPPIEPTKIQPGRDWTNATEKPPGTQHILGLSTLVRFWGDELWSHRHFMSGGRGRKKGKNPNNSA